MANEIISNEYIDVFIENIVLQLFLVGESYAVTPINSTYSMVHMPISAIDKCSLGEEQYAIFPSLWTLESMESLEESGVIRARNNPNFGMRGQGILVGLIDTGIEYQHQAFINADGTTKIVSIWDQTMNEGTGSPPNRFTYGTEYTMEEINNALSQENPLSVVPTTDEIGHGTMMAGVIAGNENRNENFSGVVPDAQLVIVKLKEAKQVNKEIFSIAPDKLCYQETDIMMGLKYLLQVADELERPLSICIAMGTSQGGHDGTGPAASYFSYASQLPRIAVTVSAGNEGNKNRHYFGRVEQLQQLKEFDLRVSNKDRMFWMELWQSVPHRLTIDIISPTGEYVPTIYPKLSDCREISFIFESSILWINNFVLESNTGDQLILIRFENPQEGIWKFRVHNMENAASEFNVWLPSGDLISEETYFLESSPDVTITAVGNSAMPITITAYDTQTGGIAIFSSRGYTRSGLVKPDLAAPGVNLTCPTLNNQYGQVTGAGAAAAHTTGVVAMLLEWAVMRNRYPNIKGSTIKKLLIRGAKRNTDIVYPNNIWGYGKVDLYGVFEMLR